MLVIEKPEFNFKRTNVRNQYIATAAVDLIMLSHGILAAWTSPAIPILASENTPLVSGPLTNDQISWIGSVNSIGAGLGAIFIGYVISILGPKRAVLLLAIPEAICWVLIYFGNQYYYLLGARFLGGFSGGAIVTALILYISQVANDDIRGRLGSSMMIFRNIGILMVYTLGATLDYFTLPCIFIAVPILFLVIFSVLPNTPQFHLQRGQFVQKRHSNSTKASKEILKKNITFEGLKATMNQQKHEESFQLSDFCNRNMLKSFAVCFALITFAQCTLNSTIKTYAVIIFQKCGASIDSSVSSIILGVAFIVGALLNSYLADILGRKFLNIVSLFGSAICISLVAIQYYLRINGQNLDAFEWIPVTCLSLVIILSSAGVVPLIFVCCVEYLPSKIRVSGFAILNVWVNFTVFASAKLYPYLVETVDLHGCLMIFATGCAIGGVFVIFCMKETSGKSLDDDITIDKEKPIQRISTISKC